MPNLKSRVTIYEVAKASGYSLATVSRVINKKTNVSEKTKKKVLETIERLGYKPSALAQGLATSKSTNIGLILPAKNYVYLSNVLSGMIDVAKIYGYQTTLFFTKPDRDEVKETIEKLIVSHVDGAILFDDALIEDDFYEISKYNIPIVVINQNVEGENMASIRLDYADAIKQCIEEHYSYFDEPIYLLHINNPGILMEKLEKIARDEMKRLNREDQLHIVSITDSYNETYNTIYEFLKENKKGCFIAPRDSLSCAVANAALDLGLSIPKDVQILSIVGTKYSTIMRPKLSSLSLDMYEVGSVAMRMMTKFLLSTLKQKTFVFKVEVVHRESSRL